MHPLITMHSAQYNKLTMTKLSFPQDNESTAGSEKLPNTSTSNKHYGAYAKVMICSLTIASPMAEDECTAVTKNNTNNAKCVAINSAHAQHDQPTIGLAQCGQNTAYHLGSTFNQTIKMLNKNKHVSFAKQTEVHLFDATSTPSIMLTYDSGANGHYISNMTNAKQASLS
jgi:hypothetical protein